MKGSIRPFRSLALVGALALLLAACSSDDGGGGGTGGGNDQNAGDRTLVISNWDAYMPKKLIPNFEAATGIDVQLAIHTTNEDIMGKITAQDGGGFDVVFVSGPFVQALVAQGWAAELDHSQIPNLANLYPEATQLAFDPGNRYSIPYAWGTTGICYRTDLVQQTPSSWDVFRNPPADLAGKMTMLGTDRWLLQPALISLGYSINTTNPAQIEEATAWTLEAKDNLLGFDDTTFYSKLVSGEASLVQAWDGWCEYGRADEPKIDFVVPDEGSDVWTDTMVILASSEHKEEAHEFLNYVLDPKVGASVSGFVLYKVPNEPAMESVDPALLEQFPTLALSPSDLFQQEAEEDLGQGVSAWSEAVAQIKAG
jgi:spermidine/putrescine transport system substrate-binding protein